MTLKKRQIHSYAIITGEKKLSLTALNFTSSNAMCRCAWICSHAQALSSLRLELQMPTINSPGLHGPAFEMFNNANIDDDIYSAWIPAGTPPTCAPWAKFFLK